MQNFIDTAMIIILGVFFGALFIYGFYIVLSSKEPYSTDDAKKKSMSLKNNKK